MSGSCGKEDCKRQRNGQRRRANAHIAYAVLFVDMVHYLDALFLLNLGPALLCEVLQWTLGQVLRREPELQPTSPLLLPTQS